MLKMSEDQVGIALILSLLDNFIDWECVSFHKIFQIISIQKEFFTFEDRLIIYKYFLAPISILANQRVCYLRKLVTRIQFKASTIYINYMDQEVKLVVAQSLQGLDQEYLIFNNVKLGEGGFGVVKKAVSSKQKSRELAVKIIPYKGDAVKRKKIEREINIIRLLPNHPNLVRVLPVKCFSQNNFYIFMEMCKQGTLIDWLSQPGLLDEGRIFDAFWQLMSGYRILWENGILHQDLKLANVLLKNGVLKITDFGFSILTEKYVQTLTRQGTLQYMSLQKLTDANFVADEKADVYSLGVMMHELITKMHPYVNQKNLKNYKEYVLALKNSQIFRPKLVSTFSAPLQGLYDLVTRMVAKSPKNRVSCAQIFDYLDNDEAFTPFRMKQKEKTQEVMLNLPTMHIIERTSVFSIPFAVSPEEEEKYIEKIKCQKEIRRNEQNQKIITKIQKWALSLRLVVYYFDRLARRLFIEKLRGGFGPQKTHSFNRIILSCLLAQSKITHWILKELRFHQLFTKEEIDLFRSCEEGMRTLKIVRRDEEYIRQELTDSLKRTTQVQVKEQMSLIKLGEREEFKDFVAKVIPYFEDCLTRKATLINSRKDLVTMIYLIDSIELLKPLPDTNQQLQLEEYFYTTETRSKDILFNEVQSYLSTRSIQSNFDEEIYSEDDQMIN